jgi:hypothetical protein
MHVLGNHPRRLEAVGLDEDGRLDPVLAFDAALDTEPRFATAGFGACLACPVKL